MFYDYTKVLTKLNKLAKAKDLKLAKMPFTEEEIKNLIHLVENEKQEQSDFFGSSGW